MLTARRPRNVPNLTAPPTSANSVSSPPRPTFSPGWKWVPRWRTMIDPAVTVVPSKTLTPRRWAFESRPFRVEPPPLVLDISLSLLVPAAADAGDLDGRVALAVAPAPAGPGLRLVGEAAHLRPFGLAHHPCRHFG